MRHLRDKSKWNKDGEIQRSFIIESFYVRAQPDRSVLIYSSSILLSYILLDYIIMPIIQDNDK